MKSSIDAPETVAETEDGRRGIFRRARRGSATTDAPSVPASDSTMPEGNVEDDVAEVDAIAQRMVELSGQTIAGVSDPDVQRELDLQRAAIARANRSSSTAPVQSPMSTPAATPAPTSPVSETTMPQILDMSTPPLTEDDIQARMDAVLNPRVSTPVTLSATTEPSVPMTMSTPAPVVQPVPVQQPVPTPAPTPAAEPAATYAPVPVQTPAAPAVAPRPSTSAPTAASLLGIDIDRMVNLLEDEARSAQQRIELEIRGAHTQASDIVNGAEAEAERIREHGQAQARVLLSEVEEIISEAQSTGEQILQRSSEEATALRSDATAVLHQAQAEARAIVETSRREGEQVLAEQRRLATVRAQEAMREQDRLKDQIRRLEERRRQVLESLEPLIAQLTQMMPTQTAAPAPARGNVVQLERTRS